MFKNPSVFILGAVASWHYGYPTGEDLVQKVIEKARIASNFFDASKGRNVELPAYLTRNVTADATSSPVDMTTLWQEAHANSVELASALKAVDPLVIDYFLGQNDSLKDIGRLMIAWVILECEKQHNQYGNINRRELLLNSPDPQDQAKGERLDARKCKDNWYRFIIHKLVTGCKKSEDLLHNRVHFVTFNYDVSLESSLKLGLHNIQLFNWPDVDEFLKPNRIMHVYGSVPLTRSHLPWHLPWTQLDFENSYNHAAYKSFLDAMYTASKDLRTIDHEKDLDKDVIEAAKKAIRDAKCVYILGYGFDEINSLRLDLPELLYYANTKKLVLFTNYKDSNRINNAASKIMFRGRNYFLSPQGTPETGWYFEKSIRDTYEALELDFEPFEELPIPGS